MKLKMSPLVDTAAGKDGPLVIRRSRSGAVATPRTYPRKTASARRSAANKNLGSAASEFTNLNDAQIAAWNAFGAGRTKTNEVNGQKYEQTGINAYIELTTVFKMASPGSASPKMPPTSSFSGDSLGFSITTSTSTILVVGTGPTSQGTVLEVALAPMKSRARRIPTTGYVVQDFYTLAQGNDYTAPLTVPAGTYAVRVRYLRYASGQTTPAQILGKATVALSVVEGGVDGETGEVVEPKARPARMRKAA